MYCITCWGNLKNKEINRLFKLQKRAIRHINKAKYNSHTEPLFKKLKLIKLEQIYQINCSKLYLQNVHSHLPQYHQTQLLSNAHYHSYQTRNMENIHMLPIKLDIERQRLYEKIPKAWKYLPNGIQTSNASIKTTIYNIRKHFIASYNDHCQLQNCYICQRV